ncbi:MAG: hypothetical protein M1294_01340 [Firmicutes bacterium]|nr:hypothetical protein [Bacillota bacterium]MCL5012383.1 hypothetical protein [Bacillota bacterium]
MQRVSHDTLALPVGSIVGTGTYSYLGRGMRKPPPPMAERYTAIEN